VDETRAFAAMPVFPEADAAALCRLVLMRILPGIAEGDANAFGRGVAELQRRVGDFFAPYQGGRYTSPAVAAAIADIEALGVAGVGQSSWGPTGFAVLGSEAEAGRLADALALRHGERLRLVVARGRNRGAEVRLGQAAASPKDPVRTP
jgi:predicted sugar kinase